MVRKECVRKHCYQTEEMLRKIGWSQFIRNLEAELLQEYENLLQQEEPFWFQQAQSKWLLEGERNTRFFNTSVLIRKAKNKVLRV